MGCVGSTPVSTDKVDEPSDAAPAADSDPVAKAEVKKYNGKAEMASIRRWRDSLPAPLQEILKEKWNDETPMDDWSYVFFTNENYDTPDVYSDVTDDLYCQSLEIDCDCDDGDEGPGLCAQQCHNTSNKHRTMGSAAFWRLSSRVSASLARSTPSDDG